jgi:hypothetical protein
MKQGSQVNSELHGKLEKRLRLKYRRVHELIQDYAAKYHLRMDHAAIKLAADNGISISKYASEDYYNAVAGKSQSPQTTTSPTQNLTSNSIRRSKFPTIKIDLSKFKKKTLNQILERDIRELNCAIESGTDKTSKTCMILSGSIAEALLLERLTQNVTIKNQAIATATSLTSYRPNDLNDIESWNLSNLVAVAEKLGVVPGDVNSQLGQLRQWRNLVHPGRELKDSAQKRIKPTGRRAENAIGFLRLLADEIK